MHHHSIMFNHSSRRAGGSRFRIHRAIVLLAASILLGSALPSQAQRTFAGITEPYLDVIVSASVSGTVAKVLIREGEEVKQGQRILELEKRREELEVSRRKLLLESTVELQAAIAEAETVALDLKGTRQLAETTQSVSKDELAKKELDYKKAVAEKERLELAEIREQIEYDMALEALSEREIDSPLSGRIAQLTRDVGEACQAQDPLIRIVDVSRCFFVSNIDSRYSGVLKEGQSVQLEVESGAETIRIAGEISFISPVVDPSSSLLRIKVLFDNSDNRVRPGVAGLMTLPGN